MTIYSMIKETIEEAGGLCSYFAILDVVIKDMVNASADENGVVPGVYTDIKDKVSELIQASLKNGV